MKRIVLAGAGHAHLHVIRQAAAFSHRAIELVLIAPEAFWYSGLATGMLGGTYPPELDQVDVAALMARGGGQSIRDRICGVDVGRRLVHLESGASLAYDAISLDLGSEPVPIAGTNSHVYPVKPISNLWRLQCDVKKLIATRGGGPVQTVIVGGGASACEIAANLLTLGRSLGAVINIALLTGEDRLLADAPRAAGAIAFRVLSERGVKIVPKARVRAIEADVAVTEDRRRFGFDFAVNATGLAPSPVIRSIGLPTDGNGALVVDRFLRSVGDAHVFGGGDCVAFEGGSLPKLGVYAVREARVLLRNLMAAAEGTPLIPYRPQKRALRILNLGDGTGIAIRGGLVLRSRLFGWLKDRIDRAFLARYRID